MTLLRANLWPVAAAIVCGFVLLPVAQKEYSDWEAERIVMREKSTPVVRMSGRLMSRDGESVEIELSGEKLRDCRFLGIEAYSVDKAGIRHIANIKRTDAVPQSGQTRPIGSYNFGRWRVWPVYGEMLRVMVFVEHACNSVAIKTLAAEVAL